MYPLRLIIDNYVIFATMILPVTAPQGEMSITSVLRDRPNKKYVKECQDYSEKMTMHMTGLKLDKYLSLIDYYENPRLLKLRQLYSPPNTDFFARLRRPVDKIFNAKGGSVNYILPDSKKKEFIEYLSDIKSDYSLRQWVETFWLPASDYDPMGIILIEVGEDEAYPAYYCVQDIWDMPKPKGREFEYLVLKLDKDQYQGTNLEGMSAGNQLFRVIDDEYDRTIRWNGGVATVLEEYPNYFGEVPAITTGYVWDNVHQRYTSAYNDVVSLADQQLRSRSQVVMYELHHGFPMSWQYAGNCPTCNGAGKLMGDPCPSCNGTGKESKRDVSKMILMPYPKDKNDPIVDKPGGVVEVAVDSWREMKATVDEQYKSAHYCMWGTHQIEDSSHETATGRFIDVQPVNDRLGKFSDAAEYVERWITNKVGEFMFGEQYGGSEINLGRRYLIETPDALADKLQKAIKEKMSYSYLKNMYFQWVDSEYSGDEMMRLKLTMEFKLDPAPFMTIQEAQKAFTDPKEYYKKLYFGQWIESLPENWYISSNYVTLQSQLDAFVDEKMKAAPPVPPQPPVVTN